MIENICERVLTNTIYIEVERDYIKLRILQLAITGYPKSLNRKKENITIKITKKGQTTIVFIKHKQKKRKTGYTKNYIQELIIESPLYNEQNYLSYLTCPTF